MKNVNVFMAICFTAIASTLVTAQEHPFHQPNWGKSVVMKNGRSIISSLELLPDKPMSKSNGVILLRSVFAENELHQNGIPDIPLSKMNYPKYFRSVMSSSSNNGNVLPQKPASKRNS